MSRGKKRATRKEGRVSGKFKREASSRVVKMMRAAWPFLSVVQVRRVLSFTYQTLRKKGATR